MAVEVKIKHKDGTQALAGDIAIGCVLEEMEDGSHKTNAFMCGSGNRIVTLTAAANAIGSIARTICRDEEERFAAGVVMMLELKNTLEGKGGDAKALAEEAKSTLGFNPLDNDDSEDDEEEEDIPDEIYKAKTPVKGTKKFHRGSRV